MPSVTDTLREDGDALLLSLSGAAVTFRSVSVNAVISWLTEELAAKRYPQFTERVESTIMLLDSTLTAANLTTHPSSGEIITDENGDYHRIIFAKHDGAGWLCACEVER